MAEQDNLNLEQELAAARHRIVLFKHLVSLEAWEEFRKVVEAQLRQRRALWTCKPAKPDEVAQMNWDLGAAEFGDVMLRIPQIAIESDEAILATQPKAEKGDENDFDASI